MIVDTNVLVRLWANDDERQSALAREQIAQSQRIVISNSALCEFVWVARQVYKQARADIMAAIRLLISDSRVSFDRSAVEAGLAFMEAGGDFADGVIEFEGREFGGTSFLTFDRRAASIVRASGRQSVLLETG